MKRATAFIFAVIVIVVSSPLALVYVAHHVAKYSRDEVIKFFENNL